MLQQQAVGYTGIPQQASMIGFDQPDLSYSSLMQLPNQFPAQFPQLFPQQFLGQTPRQLTEPSQVAAATMGMANLGSDAWRSQTGDMQDIMGLVSSMGEQARKTKGLQTALLQAQAQEQQLQGMVLAETYKSKTVDENARRLAQQAEESISVQKETLDDLKRKFAALKTQSDSDRMHLLDEDRQNKALQAQLLQAQSTLQDWQQKVATANRLAREAHDREITAVKAGELEDMALTQQETLLSKAKTELEAWRNMNDGKSTVAQSALSNINDVASRLALQHQSPVNMRQYAPPADVPSETRNLDALLHSQSGQFLGRP